jgi:hypothetical protein
MYARFLADLQAQGTRKSAHGIVHLVNSGVQVVHHPMYIHIPIS